MVHTVYEQFRGKMVKVAEPQGNPNNRNFVIQWKGLDWSGFRSLADCEIQFNELENKSDSDLDVFSVVEK